MTSTIATRLLDGIRDVTDEEVEFYTENGWVMLRELVSRELAGELLRAAEHVLPETDDFVRPRVRTPVATAGYEPFRTVAFSRQMGRVAQRLINRRRLTGSDLPIRFHSDHVWCKEPGAGPSGYHQDSTSQGADRVGEFNMWLALDEVTPEMGSMRFLTGCHREGPLGANYPDELLGLDGRPDPDRQMSVMSDRDFLQEHYPKLFELYELSAPFHYQPGDATVHHGYMVHGAPPNRTDRRRWSYILQYTPADTRYIDGSTTEDEHRIKELALPVDAVKNPIVYPAPVQG